MLKPLLSPQQRQRHKQISAETKTHSWCSNHVNNTHTQPQQKTFFTMTALYLFFSFLFQLFFHPLSWRAFRVKNPALITNARCSPLLTAAKTASIKLWSLYSAAQWGCTLLFCFSLMCKMSHRMFFSLVCWCHLECTYMQALYQTIYPICHSIVNKTDDELMITELLKA